MDYEEAIHDLNSAIYAAVRAASKASNAADNEDGAPFDAVSKIAKELREMAADVDSIVDTGMTRKDYLDAKSLYEGAKLAGLTS